MRKAAKGDKHVLRYFSSLITVSGGRVIDVTEPSIGSCPLASHLYGHFRGISASDKDAARKAIIKTVESKIRDYGFFTPERDLSRNSAVIPYGASEMLMAALKKKTIDAAVVVCDGAGTVVTDDENMVQGIGARMHSLLSTSRIDETVSRLEKAGCRIVFADASIDQFRGVEDAIKAGYTRIAVTVGGHDTEKLIRIRKLGTSKGMVVTILAVCTTGAGEKAIARIRRYADIVWSCASQKVREDIGSAALLQVSTRIPVFALTQRGVTLIAAYADNGAPLKNLSERKQYLISNVPGGQEMRLGGHGVFLREAKLPVLSIKVPGPQA